MIIQNGDIYKLGDHVLGCGSSTDKDFVDKVIGDKNIRCILVDPPYGIAYVEGTQGIEGKQRNVEDKIQGDQLQTAEEYSEFTKKWLEIIKPHLTSYNACYIFGADSMFCALREGMDKADFYCSQMLIWVKDHVVLGRKDYLPMHELIAYGWYGRHKMERSKAKSVIFHPKPSRSKLHVTQKPVGLIRKLIPNSTKTGEWVFDGFGGGGFNNDRLRAFRTQMLHDRAIGGLLRYNHSPMGETYEFKGRKVTNSLT